MQKDCTLKYVKGVSSVTQVCCVKPVTNAKLAVSNMPVGARLQNFWQAWLDLGAGPKVVQILKGAYTLPFRIRPKLTRFPTVISCYVNPHRNSYLLEALHQLIDKNAVELVQNQTYLGFFNRLFLVPKPNNKWRPILDLSKLNLFLKAEKFKMETPEIIRISLQPESLEKVIPIPRSLHLHLQWWLEEDNVLTGQPLHPIKHALQIFTEASKEGWSTHLNERTARGSWSLPESKLHINYLKLKAVFLALQEFQDLCIDKIVLVATDNTTVMSYINKEGGIRLGPLCALLWRILTWCTRHQVTLKVRHIPGRLNVVADKLSRLGQTIQTVVPPSRGLSNYMQQVALASDRPICHEVQQQVTSVCVTSTGSLGHSSGCTQSAMGGSGCICLPTSNHLGQSGREVTGLPMQENHSDCSGVAQHALVLGPSDHVQSDPAEPAPLAQPVNTAIQSDPSQKTDKSKYPCKAPRAPAIKEQGFSEAVAARIEAPQRGSTRPFLQSGVSLIRWTLGHPL